MLRSDAVMTQGAEKVAQQQVCAACNCLKCRLTVCSWIDPVALWQRKLCQFHQGMGISQATNFVVICRYGSSSRNSTRSLSTVQQA